MDTPETVTVSVAGHEIRMEIQPEERAHVESAARSVTERMNKLQQRAASQPQAKVASMVAFQFACDLNIANELLDEAEKLHEELRRQREAIRRLEDLVKQADEVLTA